MDSFEVCNAKLRISYVFCGKHFYCPDGRYTMNAKKKKKKKKKKKNAQWGGLGNGF
jgi:hypothetical protein